MRMVMRIRRAIMRLRALTRRFWCALCVLIKLVASRGFAPRPPVSETGATADYATRHLRAEIYKGWHKVVRSFAHVSDLSDFCVCDYFADECASGGFSEGDRSHERNDHRRDGRACSSEHDGGA